MSTDTAASANVRAAGEAGEAGAPTAGAAESRATDRAGRELGFVVDVPLDPSITVANPCNPRAALTNIEELAASILGGGLVSYLTVTPAAVFRDANPHMELPPTAEWVLDDGHRRRAAGLMAGLRHLPAVARRDRAVYHPVLTALLDTVQRVPLTPMEEARGLELLADETGWSQREIARHTGISQGQISRRLALCTLPDNAQQAIHQGRITVEDSLTILRRDLPRQEDRTRAVELALTNDVDIARAVRQVRHELARAARGQDPGHDAGAEPDAGTAAASHDSRGTQQPGGGAGGSRSVPSPTLAAGPSSSAAPPSSTPQTPHPADLDDDLEQHHRAALARAEACRTIARGSTTGREARELLVDLALAPPTTPPAQAHRTALTWLELPGEPEDVLERLMHAERSMAERVAVAASLARREADLSDPQWARRPWPAAARRHVERLERWNAHRLSPFERRKLNQPLP